MKISVISKLIERTHLDMQNLSNLICEASTNDMPHTDDLHDAYDALQAAQQSLKVFEKSLI